METLSYGHRTWLFWFLLALVSLPVGWAEEAQRKPAGAGLPNRVDNSTSPCFPPVIRQTHESCAQEVGVYYMMTYEWNLLHGTSAARPENQMAGGFIWNFLNRGENRGAELAEGWQLALAQGVPTMSAYGAHKGAILGAWPDGYELYHHAMTHRLRSYRFLPLSTADELLQAKRWLYECGDEKRQPGGLLAIEGRLRGFDHVTIPCGQTGEGRGLVLRWGRQGKGHVMTYVGYDDGIGYDVNADGRMTNDVDLNGDGAITLADWERGAFIAVNSYGRQWGDDGKTYVLYRESAVTPFQRGRWAASVSVRPKVVPRLTLRLRLQTSCQAAVRLRVRAEDGEPFTPLLFADGTAMQPLEPDSPERYSRFYSGKRRLSLGPARQDAEGRPLPAEIGLDLSRRLPLDAADYTLEFHFAQIDEVPATGSILAASLRRYDPAGTLVSEREFTGLPMPIRPEARQTRAKARD